MYNVSGEHNRGCFTTIPNEPGMIDYRFVNLDQYCYAPKNIFMRDDTFFAPKWRTSLNRLFMVS